MTRILALCLLLGLLTGLTGCGSAAAPAPEPTAPATQPSFPVTPPTPVRYAAGPELAIQTYYDWYRAYGREANPLVNRAYRTSPQLTDNLIGTVNALLTHFEATNSPGYDPFLCTQNRPNELTIDPAAVNGNAATVTVKTWWANGPSELTLRLVKTADQWQIDQITCPVRR